MVRRRLQPKEYTVGWICALPIELAAAQEMLDEEYEPIAQDNFDPNLYTLGRITDHNVVLACLPAGNTGTQSAATVATRMRSKFSAIRFGLMVGIGGGVPSAEYDIRLGDVVISQPHLQHEGVVQYDFGKTGLGGSITRTGWLNAPPLVLLHAITAQRALQIRGRSSLPEYLSSFDQLDNFNPSEAGCDTLFRPEYHHVGGSTCETCDKEMEIKREIRKAAEVKVHYGTIASGNQVMKDGITRDKISRELGGVICFEMEAAGLMNDLPCLVIRGICDYADSHKNKRWQPYAAATAAACAKDILSVIPVVKLFTPATEGETATERIEKRLDQFLQEILQGLRSPISLTPELDPTALEKELVNDNVTVVDVEENRDLIHTWSKDLHGGDSLNANSIPAVDHHTRLPSQGTGPIPEQWYSRQASPTVETRPPSFSKLPRMSTYRGSNVTGKRTAAHVSDDASENETWEYPQAKQQYPSIYHDDVKYNSDLKLNRNLDDRGMNQAENTRKTWHTPGHASVYVHSSHRGVSGRGANIPRPKTNKSSLNTGTYDFNSANKAQSTPEYVPIYEADDSRPRGRDRGPSSQGKTHGNAGQAKTHRGDTDRAKHSSYHSYGPFVQRSDRGPYYSDQDSNDELEGSHHHQVPIYEAAPRRKETSSKAYRKYDFIHGAHASAPSLVDSHEGDKSFDSLSQTDSKDSDLERDFDNESNPDLADRAGVTGNPFAGASTTPAKQNNDLLHDSMSGPQFIQRLAILDSPRSWRGERVQPSARSSIREDLLRPSPASDTTEPYIAFQTYWKDPANKTMHCISYISLPCSLETLFRGGMKALRYTRRSSSAQLGGSSSESCFVKLNIVKGVVGGSRQILKHHGDFINGDHQDLHIKIKEQEHPRFRRIRADLHTMVTITLRESLCGWNKYVQTIDEEWVNVEHAGPTPSDWTFTVPNFGMPIFNRPDERGDMVVCVKIDYPHRLTEAQKTLLRKVFPKPND